MYPVFENGSCWVKVDFHLHTRADKEFRYAGEPDRYIREYVSSLKAAEVGVGVITNHNKFDHGEFKALRKAARREGMELLPGVELSVNDGQAGVHTLVVFADEWFINPQQTNHIESFLTATFAGVDNFENENARSTENITQTIQRLDRYERDYFIVFAHVEAPNGLWGGLSPGRIRELFDNELVRRRVMGFQKVMTHDLRVKIQGVLGERYPAEVQGCDAKTLDHISARKVASYLKLGDYSFEAVRFALQDFPNRVSGEKPALIHSHIRQIAFEGAGSLGGTVVKLSPELNTLIGIRGSGKSSILEGIRYALDIPFGEKASDRDYKENLVSNLLKSGGKITVDAVCRHGRTYQIMRIFGQEPQIIFDGLARHGVALRETVLHKPVYFGQKDLSNTGAGFEHDLIEKLVGERLAPVRERIRQQNTIVLERLGQLRRLKTSGEALSEWQAKEKDAQFRLRFYAQHGMEEKLERQTTFGRDERYLSSTTSRATRALDSLRDGIRETLEGLKQEQKHESAHNQADIDDYRRGYDRFTAHLGSLNTIVDDAGQLLAELDIKQQAFLQKKQALTEEFAKIERGLAEELRLAGVEKADPADFLKLKTGLEVAELKIAELTRAESSQTLLEKSLTEALNRLYELWVEEYQEIEAVLTAISQADSPLKIVPSFARDKKAMQVVLKEACTGSRLRESTYQTVADSFRDFGELWLNRDKLPGIINSSAETFSLYLEQQIESLIVWQIPNIYTIEFRGKPLEQHSLGQRASALMLFVLNQQNNDVVIIDQPEDDLDNQTIYDDVIKIIRIMKPRTQFIFATHNANIPVLGDAENVCACKYANGKIHTAGGGVDAPLVQQHIISVMEGGREAFERRREVYGSWLSKT
ncbi:TrlF family AAA-like ATPase [Pantoea agglomerans]|uniref:TrlF family AAA-like ATPase n=1 Tax=Enterobacter agglomerans TaxID=549 RepID=UPI0013CAC3ED|nr:histidinol-phosphatase [Pantoea agglomerans]NEG81056.1 histidinol-phosphatase [Pantoea agglomerans]